MHATFGEVTCDEGGNVAFEGGENLDALEGFEDQGQRWKYDVKARVNCGESNRRPRDKYVLRQGGK